MCSIDDILLRGGVREEHHVEITGECGSGKTQLCMQVRPLPHISTIVLLSHKDAKGVALLQSRLDISCPCALVPCKIRPCYRISPILQAHTSWAYPHHARQPQAHV